MFGFKNLYFRAREAKDKNQPLYLVSLMLFFWAIFDGIISYVTPLVVTESGLSKTSMGLIYSSSSVFGAIFDFFLSKYLRNTHYRRLFLLVFAICFLYPLVLGTAKTPAIFVLAMALWGFYYDLLSFGKFDFVSRHSDFDQHCSSFSFLGIFKSLGYLLAPVIAGLLILDKVGPRPFLAASLALGIAFLFYLWLAFSRKKNGQEALQERNYKPLNFLREFALWGKVGRILLPVLVFMIVLDVFDAFFWTIGPLYSENFKNFTDFGGLFMAMYTLPVLLTGWLIGPLTARFGKKRSAYAAFIISSTLLLGLPFLSNPLLILLLVFSSSMVGSLAWPAISGAFVDYITEAAKYEKEIEGLNDFFANAGYVLGPALAGFLADKAGNDGAFFLLGTFGILVVSLLLLVTPKEIKVVV